MFRIDSFACFVKQFYCLIAKFAQTQIACFDSSFMLSITEYSGCWCRFLNVKICVFATDAQ